MGDIEIKIGISIIQFKKSVQKASLTGNETEVNEASINYLK